MQARLLQIKLTGVLIFIFCSGIAHAGYDVSELKKLFTDRSQRAQIDAARSGGFSGEGSQQAKELKVTGYVTRSNGKSVVWVNNKSTLEGTKLGNVKVHQASVGKNKKVTLILPEKTIRLKPGEAWQETQDYHGSNQ